MEPPATDTVTFSPRSSLLTKRRMRSVQPTHCTPRAQAHVGAVYGLRRSGKAGLEALCSFEQSVASVVLYSLVASCGKVCAQCSADSLAMTPCSSPVRALRTTSESALPVGRAPHRMPPHQAVMGRCSALQRLVWRCLVTASRDTRSSTRVGRYTRTRPVLASAKHALSDVSSVSFQTPGR